MKSIKYIFSILLSAAFPIFAVAQEAKEATKVVAKESFVLDANTVLTIVAALLLFPILSAAKTFMNSANYFAKNDSKKSSHKVSSILIILMMVLSNDLLAQTKVDTPYFASTTFTYFLLTIIVLEISLIVFLTVSANSFIQSLTKEIQNEKIPAPSIFSKLSKYWKKANNFVPIEKEADIDTGHSYDGIRELDNVTPPWFTAAFMASILFAIVYLYRNHVSHAAPNQIQEFEIAMQKAEEEKNLYLATQSNNIDENNVTLLTGDDIDAGKDIFIHKCVACHADNGASRPGGVGPNLTDNNWIHGGSLKNIFTTIKNGWPEKGMIAWKDQLSPKQIAQVSSFIKSIKGTVPSGGKEAQGELYEDEKSSIVSDSAAVKNANTK